jgi:hypothetical protein
VLDWHSKYRIKLLNQTHDTAYMGNFINDAYSTPTVWIADHDNQKRLEIMTKK